MKKLIFYGVLLVLSAAVAVGFFLRWRQDREQIFFPAEDAMGYERVYALDGNMKLTETEYPGFGVVYEGQYYCFEDSRDDLTQSGRQRIVRYDLETGKKDAVLSVSLKYSGELSGRPDWSILTSPHLLQVAGGYVYFLAQGMDGGFRIYRETVDGEDYRSYLPNVFIMSYTVAEGRLYYYSDSEGQRIYSLDLESGQSKAVTNEATIFNSGLCPLFVFEGRLYYHAFVDGAFWLYSVGNDGAPRRALDRELTDYNYYNGWLYYFSPEEDGNKATLIRHNMKTGAERALTTLSYDGQTLPKMYFGRLGLLALEELPWDGSGYDVNYWYIPYSGEEPTLVLTKRHSATVYTADIYGVAPLEDLPESMTLDELKAAMPESLYFEGLRSDGENAAILDAFLSSVKSGGPALLRWGESADGENYYLAEIVYNENGNGTFHYKRLDFPSDSDGMEEKVFSYLTAEKTADGYALRLTDGGGAFLTDVTLSGLAADSDYGLTEAGDHKSWNNRSERYIVITSKRGITYNGQEYRLPFPRGHLARLTDVYWLDEDTAVLVGTLKNASGEDENLYCCTFNCRDGTFGEPGCEVPAIYALHGILFDPNGSDSFRLIGDGRAFDLSSDTVSVRADFEDTGVLREDCIYGNGFSIFYRTRADSLWHELAKHRSAQEDLYRENTVRLGDYVIEDGITDILLVYSSGDEHSSIQGSVLRGDVK